MLRLPVDAVEELWRRATLCCTPAGGTLVAQGSPSDHLILLLTGHATVTAAAANGRLVVLDTRVAPAALDKVATFSGKRHLATIVADETAWWCALPRAELDSILDRHPHARRHVLNLLAQSAHQARSSFIDVSTRPSPARLAQWLLENSRDAQAVLPRPQDQLAHRLGMTRVTLSRALHGFAEAHLIAMHGQNVTILDADRLRQVTNRSTGRGERRGSTDSIEEGRTRPRGGADDAQVPE